MQRQRHAARAAIHCHQLAKASFELIDQHLQHFVPRPRARGCLVQVVDQSLLLLRCHKASLLFCCPITHKPTSACRACVCQKGFAAERARLTGLFSGLECKFFRFVRLALCCFQQPPHHPMHSRHLGCQSRRRTRSAPRAAAGARNSAKRWREKAENLFKAFRRICFAASQHEKTILNRLLRPAPRNIGVGLFYLCSQYLGETSVLIGQLFAIGVNPEPTSQRNSAPGLVVPQRGKKRAAHRTHSLSLKRSIKR